MSRSASKRVLQLITVILVFSSFCPDIAATFAAEVRIQDPTRPPVTGASGAGNAAFSRFRSWTLSSTLISTRRSLAIINGRIFAQGDTFEGVEVRTIQPGAVELRHEGATHWLHAASAIQKTSRPLGGDLP